MLNNNKNNVVSIGFKANKDKIVFVIYNDSNNDIVIDKVILPLFLNELEKLSYLRNTLLDIIREFNITNASIKCSENSAYIIQRKVNIERIQIESIIKEVLVSSGIKNYLILKNKEISEYLNMKEKSYSQAIIRKKSKNTTNLIYLTHINELQEKIINLKEQKDKDIREAMAASFVALKRI